MCWLRLAPGDPISYQGQWQYKTSDPTTGFWTNLVDGRFISSVLGPAAVSGALTNTLRVTNVYDDLFNVRFRPQATTCSTATSEWVSLENCSADYANSTGALSCDGGVTIEDLLAYLGQFSQGRSAADLDDGSGTGRKDGGMTIEDLLYYLERFTLGC